MERGLDWYKRDPIKFLDGVQGMGPDLIGAYAVIIDLLYARAGKTPRDDRHLSGILGCSMRKSKALTDELIAIGKITFDDGFITNSRAFEQSKSRRELSETRASAGRKGGENSAKSRKNNGLGEANASSKSQAEKKREEESLLPSVIDIRHSDQNDELTMAFDYFVAMAQRAGLSVPSKLTASRKSKLKARLSDAEGIDGWRDACDRVEKSSFCTGKSKGGWRANFDFMLQQSSFQKIIEGSYDDTDSGAHNGGPYGGSHFGDRSDPHARQMEGFIAVAAQGPPRS